MHDVEGYECEIKVRIEFNNEEEMITVRKKRALKPGLCTA